MKFLKLMIAFMSFWVAVCIDVPQEEIDIMNDIVMDHQEWLSNAWEGKVSNSKSKIIKKEIERAKKDKRAIDLSDEDAVIKNRLSTHGYKPRKKRGKDEDTW